MYLPKIKYLKNFIVIVIIDEDKQQEKELPFLKTNFLYSIIIQPITPKPPHLLIHRGSINVDT